MTKERVREILKRTPDDVLIDIATTCSDRGVALCAEMALRKRYPSRKAAKPAPNAGNFLADSETQVALESTT